MTNKRQAAILELLKKDAIVKTSDLVGQFHVSNETIRRDLEALEKQGFLRRVYGGAVPGSIYGSEPVYTDRKILHYKEKRAIAQKAAELISDNDTLFLDGGTTLAEFADVLAESGVRHLTLITNAVSVALTLVRNPDFDVILLGGTLSQGEPLTDGFVCDQDLNYFHAKYAVIGAGGISEENGISDYGLNNSAGKRKMIRRSDHIICLADHSKFGVSAVNCNCPISDLSVLITDSGADTRYIDLCRELGVKVEIAEV